jgi:hypothetical protein
MQGGAADADVLFQAKRWAMHRDGTLGAPKVLTYDVGVLAARRYITWHGTGPVHYPSDLSAYAYRLEHVAVCSAGRECVGHSPLSDANIAGSSAHAGGEIHLVSSK